MPYGRMSLRTALATAVLVCAASAPLWSAQGDAPAAPRAEAPAEKPARRGTIGVSLLSKSIPYFVDVNEGMLAEAARRGYSVAVVDGRFDAAVQARQVEQFIAQKVDAIVLAPCDSKAVGESIKRANAAGIPVFTVDIASAAKDAKVVTHVGTDNALGGKMAAEEMVKALGGKGKVAIMDYPQVAVVVQRTGAFTKRLAELNAGKGVNVKVVVRLPGQGSLRKSMEAMSDILQAHPDISGVFAINDPSAIGAARALRAAGRKAVVIGFDGQIDARRAIMEGLIHATVVQFPGKLGAASARAVADHLAGKVVKATVMVPPALYRKADADKDPLLKKNTEKKKPVPHEQRRTGSL